MPNMTNELLLRDLLSALKERFASPFAAEPSAPIAVQNRIEMLLSIMEGAPTFFADDFLVGCLIVGALDKEVDDALMTPLVEAAVRAIRINDPAYLTPSTLLDDNQKIRRILRIWYTLPQRINAAAQVIAQGRTSFVLLPEKRSQMAMAYLNLGQQMYAELGLLIEAIGA